MASASRSTSSRSRLTAPRTRTARPGPGNGWRLHHLVGQAQLGADGAHLVLEQVAQRLDQLELHVLGQAADVVVGLDAGGGAALGVALSMTSG